MLLSVIIALIIMRGFLSHYEQRLQKVDDKYGLNLDLRDYESFAERNVDLHDLPTVANAISLAGLALVVDGCKNIGTINGVNKIAVGRGLDLFDGSVARWRDQCSDMGALVDVTFDKLGMLAIATAAWIEDALPKSYISYLFAKNSAHAALTTAAGYMHPTESFRPPRAGKHAMFLDNLAGGALLYANAFENERPEEGHHTKLRTVGRRLIVASMIPEAIAMNKYIKWIR